MTMTKRRKRPSLNVRPVEIVLPATSANLGPAFDAAALALKLFLTVRARTSADYSISATGRDSAICGHVENHLILTTYREVLHGEGKTAQPLSLQIRNDIPIGKGCGSSAAARLAGIALAVHFGKLSWPDSRIIGEASRREHHADNAAACWLGGLTVARMASNKEAQTVRIIPKGKWPLLLAIPDQSLSTEKARQVLPAQYSREDVVTNIQNSMLLLAALMQGRPELVSEALEDRMHQPYRSSLCPLLPALQTLRNKSGILGVALSGAGPSVLIFVAPKALLTAIKARVQKHLRAAGLSAELISTTITELGGNSPSRSFHV
jgi:homoserine kinase